MPDSRANHHDLGHIFIDGIDLNCHGLTEFLCEERVEYAWMMQLLLGRITGALSALQVSLDNTGDSTQVMRGIIFL